MADRCGSAAFLSTPSARRATTLCAATSRPAGYFYPRPPRGGRLLNDACSFGISNFYPRPPRGGRHHIFLLLSRGFLFLSTPSARRATRCGCTMCGSPSISIHALREEGDQKGEPIQIPLSDFYPRPPRGGRPADYLGLPTKVKFLSTPSARRATLPVFHPACLLSISIHALREEGDRISRVSNACGADFYPRPPRGGRQGNTAALSVTTIFLSTPSARRATSVPRPDGSARKNFYPRPPRGGRHTMFLQFVKRFLFLSTPSARRATQGQS